MYDFNEQVVLVTGATGNLGQTVARAFAGAGARVVLTDRSTGKLAPLFGDLPGAARPVLAEGVDVGQEEAMQQLVARLRQETGRLDVVVNCVGGWEGMKLTHETSLETWDNLMNKNGRVVFNVCRAVLPLLLEQQRGRIINVGARQALVSSPKEAIFAASKRALAQLTEIMAAEYRQQNITVNAVMPSMIDSPQVRQWMPQATSDQFVTAGAITEVIMFLASPAAANVSGALLPVYARQL